MKQSSIGEANIFATRFPFDSTIDDLHELPDFQFHKTGILLHGNHCKTVTNAN